MNAVRPKGLRRGSKVRFIHDPGKRVYEVVKKEVALKPWQRLVIVRPDGRRTFGPTRTMNWVLRDTVTGEITVANEYKIERVVP